MEFQGRLLETHSNNLDVVPTVICKENQDVPNVNTPSGAWPLKGTKINNIDLVALYVLSSLHVIIINNKNLKLAYAYYSIKVNDTAINIQAWSLNKYQFQIK